MSLLSRSLRTSSRISTLRWTNISNISAVNHIRAFASTPPPSIAGDWIETSTTGGKDGQAASSHHYYKYFSHNKFVRSTNTASTGNSTFQVINPATQDVVAVIPENTAEEFDDVVAKSVAAGKEWSRVPVQQRQRVMLEYQRLIRERTDDLAALITCRTPS